MIPELPDIIIYLDALRARIIGERLERVRIISPFLVRTVAPAPESAVGRQILELRRLGKRIVWGFQGDLYWVFHLMIAGRLRWRGRGTKVPRRNGLAAFDFPEGTLLLTEASTKKRASLHVVEGQESLERFDPGGLEVLDCAPREFAEALLRENHTLKRSLTDPRIFSGIGNAYSDEILHRARLSPLRLTQSLGSAEVRRLHSAVRDTLNEWSERLKKETGDRFPEKVTAFREGMAVHGRYGEPCPTCGHRVMRIVYAENETNYCAQCQNAGKVLADRALSRLLKKDWPRTLDEFENTLGNPGTPKA